ncbi:type II secretion system F family protein [Hyphomonas johnsonii]|jgi:tight adherence protein B|uniref:Putative Flp pilus assembly protein TadB n=1 Tax=Hyphomonas johnsonii MHS-2 TaxID=1280950 RepID=A0A059FTF9_9PROT|nr:type II secretion system F family protein [Hyphomonas johnsonii]KCZ93960.1 putative Flp pilus assembly protein TadB [Hyphomonas johnsonii MHS-2]
MPGLPDLSNVSMVLVIPFVMAAGAFFLLIQATLSLVTQAQTQRIVNQRLQFKDRFASTNEAMVELRKSRGLDADGNFMMPVAWFNRLVVRTGLPYQPWKWAGMALVGSVVVAGAYIHFVGGWVGAIGVSLAAFVAGPLFVLNHVANKRMKQLATQLPDALQIVCRSLEAGHPVATAVALVAREMPDPIGTEFGMAADEVSYGFSLTNAVQRMAERAGDPDVELFGATVRLQEKTGGNLCELLKANTTTIRERQTMRLKVRAASSEGRVSAMILTAAPFMVMAAIYSIQPSFYLDVIDDPMIQYGFAGLFTWMFIGNMVMRKMINFKM